MNKRIKTLFRYFIYYPVAVILLLEIFLRILGFDSYGNEDYSVNSKPNNAFVGHPYLGIQLNNGEYEISINKGLTFKTKHLNNSREVYGNHNSEKPQAIFLGCSFTYGFGVDDHEHFTSILQKMYQELNFQNFGVIGYGNVQSLIQLKDIVKTDSVKLVILNFSSFHFMRNRLSQQYRSNLKIGYGRSSTYVNNQMDEAKFPFKTNCEEEIEYVAWNDIYTNWFGREWSATVNLLQTTYDKLIEDLEEQIEITTCIIDQMNTICQQNKIKFGVVCLDSTKETELLRSRLENVSWIDAEFDFSNKNITNYPYDSHPNYQGHQLIAKKIEPFLTSLLNDN